MAPTRKSMQFLTSKSRSSHKQKENTFLYRLSDFSSTINNRKKRTQDSRPLKNIVSLSLV